MFHKKTSSSDPISLDLNESCYSEDPTSCLPDITPLWAGYSPPTPGGEPTAYAPVVYANYCQESDYEYLENLGVSVKGCPFFRTIFVMPFFFLMFQ